jgi:hypothetical protein
MNFQTIYSTVLTTITDSFAPPGAQHPTTKKAICPGPNYSFRMQDFAILKFQNFLRREYPEPSNVMEVTTYPKLYFASDPHAYMSLGGRVQTSWQKLKTKDISKKRSSFPLQSQK